jgi:hypothetical protein
MGHALTPTTLARPQSSAGFALSALINLGACTLDELKALTIELARVARELSADDDIDPATMEPVLEALDSASDLIDEVHVLGGLCVTCSGTGEGRWSGTRCHKCGGTGGQQ